MHHQSGVLHPPKGPPQKSLLTLIWHQFTLTRSDSYVWVTWNKLAVFFELSSGSWQTNLFFSIFPHSFSEGKRVLITRESVLICLLSDWQIFLTFSDLPALQNGESYSCFFGEYKSPAILMGSGIMCPSPDPNHAPSLNTGTGEWQAQRDLCVGNVLERVIKPLCKNKTASSLLCNEARLVLKYDGMRYRAKVDILFQSQGHIVSFRLASKLQSCEENN